MEKAKSDLKPSMKRGKLLLAGLCVVSWCVAPMHGLASSSGSSIMISQQKGSMIHGTVTDENGETIIGAYVVKKGQRTGSITDVQGNFTIEAAEGTELVVSCVGFQSTSFVVKAGKSTYAITLKEDRKTLEDVVVVGYGTQKKVNLTGSIATVTADKLVNRTGSDVTNMLTGLMPGVTIIQNSSLPGSDQGILRVRGLGTMGNASAMVIIDGVESSMSEVNPNDIDNISVLKDAAASAIYGVRAANGVILITTKHGQKGKATVSYDGYTGWQQATRMPKYVGAYDYAMLMNKAYVNDGQTAPYSDAELQKFKDGSDPDRYPDSDWLNALLSENGFFHNHHIGIKGGGDRVVYSLALNYFDKDGLIYNTNFKKFNVRTNLDAQINKRVKLSTNISFYRSRQLTPADGVDNLMHYAFRESPVTPIQFSDGRYPLFKNEHNSVAYSRIGGTSKDIVTSFQGNLGLTVDIVDGLKFRGIAAGAFRFDDNPVHTKSMPFYTMGASGTSLVKTTQSSISEYDIKHFETNLQAYLDYNKTFGKHAISGLLGLSQMYQQTRYLYAKRKNIPNSLSQLNAGEVTGQSTDGTEVEYALRSAFGRLNYVYADKYLFEANLRYDGTSRFPKNKRFGAFPSFSLGWRISEEGFMQSTKSWLSNLKLRLSWGLLGNQETVNSDGTVNYYPYQNTYSYGYDYSFNNSLQTGISISSRMANPNITWEKTAQWNLGLDATFFGNNLNFTLDIFRKDTRDILLQLPVPGIMGVKPPMQNAGKVRNTGFEFQANYNNRCGELIYSVTGNFSYVRNKIVDLSGGDTPGQSVGDPLWAYYGYVCDGIFRSTQEVNDHPKQTMGDAVPGDLKYRNLNTDQTIDSNDRTVLGSYFPKINYGLNFNLQYKGFDMSAVLQGAASVKGLPVAEIRYAFYNGGKLTDKYLDSWTPENPNASMPRLSMKDKKNRIISSFWVQDASYLKVRNIQLGYSLPSKLIGKYGISRLRVYGSIDNLLTISNFDSVDPELVSGTYYPLTRNYTFGLNITF